MFAAFAAMQSLVSCSAPEYRRELVEADSLSSVAPRRAMAMLDSISPYMADAPEHERMYYRLLCIKASDKAYIRHKSDSAILPLVEYYEGKNDKKLLAEAYYYAGRTYANLNDAPRALGYYQKAVDVLPDDDMTSLRGTLYFQMSCIFSNQALYNKAIDMLYKAYSCDVALNDSVNIIYTLRDLAYNYNKVAEKDSSLYYYNKAYEQANRIGNEYMKIMLLAQMASFYIGINDYAKAKDCLQPAFEADDTLNASPNYCMALKICMNTGQHDSAFFYGRELLKMGTVYAKQTASRCLTELYLARRDYDKAAENLELFKKYTDSVNNITVSEAVDRVNSLYNYNLREQENLVLKAENLHNLTVFVIIGAIGCLIISVFMVYTYRNRQRQKIQSEKLKRLKTHLFEQSEEFIKANEKKIKELEHELKKVSEKNKELIDRMEERRTDLILANDMASRKQAKHEAAMARLASTDIYATIRDYIKRGKVMTDREWDLLDNVVNREVESFKSNLYGYYAISNHEYHVCLLVRLGISPKNMATLLGCTTSAVSKARKRLQEKFFSDSGTAKDFDNFIKSL